MSVEVQRWVWKYSRATGNDRLVLLAIADHAHDDGSGAFPSQVLLMEKTRLAKRTVRDCIGRLKKLGELEVGRTGRQNRYKVLMTIAAESAAIAVGAGPIAAESAGLTGGGLPVRKNSLSTDLSANHQEPPDNQERTAGAPGSGRSPRWDPIWDTVIAATGWDEHHLDNEQRGRVGAVVRYLVDQPDVDPTDIFVFEEEYLAAWGIPLAQPESIKKYWPAFRSSRLQQIGDQRQRERAGRRGRRAG